MTAVAPAADRTDHALDVSFGRVLRSEWTKFRSVRSTWWSLALAVLLIVGIGVFSQIQGAKHADSDRFYTHPGPVDLAQDSLFGTYVAALAVLGLAALFVTGEYGTGMIRSSLTVVPGRTAMLLAKAAVLVAVIGVATSVAAVLTFLVDDVVWASHDRAGASFTDPGVLGAVAGVPLYLCLSAVFALAVGVLVRNTAAAVSILVAIFFVAPAMLASQDVAPYLPSNAGGALAGLGLGDSLSGGVSMALFAGYTVVLLALAAGRLRRSDV